MNPLNYASLEASKRLVDAGIVLETEKCWRFTSYNKAPFVTGVEPGRFSTDIPDPCMAEVWRELPESIEVNGWLAFKNIQQVSFSFASYKSNDGESKVFKNTNPTDALIDLFIDIVRENKW